PYPSSFSHLPPPPPSTLFPYTTLFRSHRRRSSTLPKAVKPFAAAVAERHCADLGRRSRTMLRWRQRSDRCLAAGVSPAVEPGILDRKSTRLNSSHVSISYAVFCLKKKK